MGDEYPFSERPIGSSSDSSFTIYDARHMINDPRVLGPQSHSEGIAFWFRPDTSRSMYEKSNALHGRPGTMAGAEQVKHRRTRSGCFICRSRRVKCDETRPICERCKKGNRECEFPQPTSSSKPNARGRGSDGRKTSRSDAQGSDAEELEWEGPRGFKTIKDEDEDDVLSVKVASSAESHASWQKQNVRSLTSKKGHKQQSQSSTESKDKARSPSSTDTSSSFPGSQTPASSFRTWTNSSTTTPVEQPAPWPRWAHLPKDLQLYLQYQQDHLTHYHYFFKLDHYGFIHRELIDLALAYGPLLYAVVGFAAYHYTIGRHDGKVQHFLGYYSQSMSLLRKALEEDQPRTPAMLLTILQLATFEEYLGDWVSLVGHHRAAYQMLLELYDPTNVMETETTRKTFAWYARYDVIAGLLARSETQLSREWYVANRHWYEQRIDPDGDDIPNNEQAIVCSLRLVGMDMAALFSKLPRGAISIPDFLAENQFISETLADIQRRIQSLHDEDFTVRDFPWRRDLDIDDIVDPYVPGGLFRDALWDLNVSWIDWYAIKQMHIYQTSAVMQQLVPPELEIISLEQCRIYEAIARCPHAPLGNLLGIQQSLGLAAVFLHKDQRHTMWIRKRLADVEKLGYIYPPTFRKKMAEVWHLPEIEQWWLPGGDESYTPLLHSIRAFGEERSAEQRKAHRGDDIQDMKGLFSELNIEEHRPTSSPSIGSISAGMEPTPESTPERSGPQYK